MAATASRLTDREHLPYKVDVQQPTPRHCSPSCGNSVHDRWNTHAKEWSERLADFSRAAELYLDARWQPPSPTKIQ
jgi:hypothetical protein